MAFFNKPEFVFPCDEQKAKTLPIHKAIPGEAGELALLGIRAALEGERLNSIVQVEHGGLLHEMHRHFIPYTDEISVVMLRNPLNERNTRTHYEGTVQQLSNLYKSRTWLAPTDPHIVFWIDDNFVYRDQRYQPNILLRNPETQFSGPTKIEDEVLPKDAKIIEQAVLQALETTETQYCQLTILKQCCWVTEDIIIFYLNKNLVMSTVVYTKTICTKYQHLPMHGGMSYLPEDLVLTKDCGDRSSITGDQG